jgi:hypothetical protein
MDQQHKDHSRFALFEHHHTLTTFSSPSSELQSPSVTFFSRFIRSLFGHTFAIFGSQVPPRVTNSLVYITMLMRGAFGVVAFAGFVASFPFTSNLSKPLIPSHLGPLYMSAFIFFAEARVSSSRVSYLHSY